LAPYRPLYYIQEPATIDGGDILRLGKTIYVGLSSRSNFAAIEQMQAIVAAYGYQVSPLKVSGCLHLKSAITQIGEDMLLINPAWVDTGAFAGWKGIHIDASEPYAANTVLVGATLLYPIGYPRTQQRLEEHGIAVHGVDVSELIKAEGAVTCCSLLFHSYTSRQTQYTSHGHIL
jgi:dimethylargininase